MRESEDRPVVAASSEWAKLLRLDRGPQQAGEMLAQHASAVRDDDLLLELRRDVDVADLGVLRHEEVSPTVDLLLDVQPLMVEVGHNLAHAVGGEVAVVDAAPKRILEGRLRLTVAVAVLR